MRHIIFFAVLILTIEAHTKCVIVTSDNAIAPYHDDRLYWILDKLTKCPVNILELENEFEKLGRSFMPYMVANRGRLNPSQGSFSFFEVTLDTFSSGLEDEVFIGHFTMPIEGVIELDQEPSIDRKLLIEAIAWDKTKNLYNFYELISQNESATWFYRGDSLDALRDNRYLHRTPPSENEKFGNIMRCSACHNSGAPIMKELSYPHNDWWQKQYPLTFGNNKLSEKVKMRVNRLLDASILASLVKTSRKKLDKSESYKAFANKRSWQEILRPLFCSTEINLASSTARLKDDNINFFLPSSFVLNPLLKAASVKFSKQEYQLLLKQYGLHFPETNEQDADHIWLTPVISNSDLLAIKALIRNNFISEKTAIDVLMIDFEKPIFSSKRCELLSSVPSHNLTYWYEDFITSLEQRSEKHAKDLLSFLRNNNSFNDFHEPALKAYKKNISMPHAIEHLFKMLLDLRQEAFTNEIAKNPLGQILEPGFRVIFPEQG